MNVAVLQLDCAWENKAANYAKVRDLFTAAHLQPGTLVVLPEMFATGFTLDLDRAEDTGAALAKIARDHQVNLLAGLVRRSPGGPSRDGGIVAEPANGRDETRPSKSSYHNEAVLFDAHGHEVAAYAKRHPFRPGGEAVEAGTQPVVVPCGEFQLAPAICYDLRFPEVFRDCVKHGANLFAVLASWPTARIDHWLALLKARAIENQAYVIGANRCGRDPNNDYPGRSQIISPRGEVLDEAGAAEGVIQAELDLSALVDYRLKFPALANLQS